MVISIISYWPNTYT